MKILVLTPTYSRYEGDGRAPFVRAHSREMARRGHQVTVIASAPPDFRQRMHVLDNVPIYRFRYFFPQRMQKLSYTASGGMPESWRKSWLAKIQLPLFILSFFLRALPFAWKTDVIHAQWVF